MRLRLAAQRIKFAGAETLAVPDVMDLAAFLALEVLDGFIAGPKYATLSEGVYRRLQH